MTTDKKQTLAPHRAKAIFAELLTLDLLPLSVEESQRLDALHLRYVQGLSFSTNHRAELYALLRKARQGGSSYDLH